MGICAGGYLASVRYLALLNAEVQSGEVEVPRLGPRSLAVRSRAVVAMALTEEGRQVFGGPSGTIDVSFSGGPIFLAGDRPDLPGCIVLARYRTEVCDIEPQRGTMVGTPSIIGARLGRGRVIAIGAAP